MSTEEETPIGLVLTGSDDDADPLVFSVESRPAHGKLSGLVPDLVYTPDPQFTGADSFTFTAYDGQVASAPATVSITVARLNDAPVGVPDSYVTSSDVALVVGAPGVLGNDSDPDGDPLAAAVVAQPGHGSVAVNPDGSFTYTPASGFVGADSFTYAVSDPHGAVSEPVTVSISVSTGPVCTPSKSVSSVTGSGVLEGGATLAVNLRLVRLPLLRTKVWVGAVEYWDRATKTRVVGLVWTTNRVAIPLVGSCGGVRIRVDAVNLGVWPWTGGKLDLRIANSGSGKDRVEIGYPGITAASNLTTGYFTITK